MRYAVVCHIVPIIGWALYTNWGRGFPQLLVGFCSRRCGVRSFGCCGWGRWGHFLPRRQGKRRFWEHDALLLSADTIYQFRSKNRPLNFLCCKCGWSRVPGHAQYTRDKFTRQIFLSHLPKLICAWFRVDSWWFLLFLVLVLWWSGSETVTRRIFVRGEPQHAPHLASHFLLTKVRFPVGFVLTFK